jgi:hypothetical protein
MNKYIALCISVGGVTLRKPFMVENQHANRKPKYFSRIICYSAFDLVWETLL